MFADTAFAEPTRKRVRTRLAEAPELTREMLEAAIAELEDARLPF
jgi:hypothetical protein